MANKVYMFRQQLLHIFTQIHCTESVSSVCRACGSSRLVHSHGFTEPAGKVYLLHLRPLDKCMVLKQKHIKQGILILNEQLESLRLRLHIYMYEYKSLFKNFLTKFNSSGVFLKR